MVVCSVLAQSELKARQTRFDFDAIDWTLCTHLIHRPSSTSKRTKWKLMHFYVLLLYQTNSIFFESFFCSNHVDLFRMNLIFLISKTFFLNIVSLIKIDEVTMRDYKALLDVRAMYPHLKVRLSLNTLISEL